MKRLLLASVAALALFVAEPSANAQISLGGTIVFDPTQAAHMLEEIGYSTETAANTATTIEKVVDVYNETVQVYNMTTNVWNSVAEAVGANNFATGLNSAYLRNPLPYQTTAHPGYIGGLQDPSGLPYGGQYVGQNTVGGNPGIYDDGSFMGPEIKKAIYSISAAQAISTNHMQAAEQRITGVLDLFAQLVNTNTVQETTSLNARLHNEHQFLNSQLLQMVSAGNTMRSQIEVLKQNKIQWTYQDEALGIGTACATVSSIGAGMTVPACQDAGGGGATALNGRGTLFTGTPGVAGAGQAIADPTATSPSGFLNPGTETPVTTGGGAPAAFVNPDTGAPLNTGG